MVVISVGAVTLFAAGVLSGLIVALIGMVLFFFALVRGDNPAIPASSTTAETGVTQGPFSLVRRTPQKPTRTHHTAGLVTDDRSAGFRRLPASHQASRPSVPATSSSITLPRPLVCTGQDFAGLLWLAPPPAHKPQQQKPSLPIGWPPYSQDTDNVHLSVPWQGKSREGVLLLTRSLPGQDIQLLRIPLTGVKVRLAQEWSTNKSDWWKRAPIELSHPDKQRLLLPVYKGGNWIQDQQDPDSGDGGSVLLLFAESGASKEQWHSALLCCCSGGDGTVSIQSSAEDGSKIQPRKLRSGSSTSLQEHIFSTAQLYNSYCRHMMRLHPSTLVQRSQQQAQEPQQQQQLQLTHTLPSHGSEMGHGRGSAGSEAIPSGSIAVGAMSGTQGGGGARVSKPGQPPAQGQRIFGFLSQFTRAGRRLQLQRQQQNLLQQQQTQLLLDQEQQLHQQQQPLSAPEVQGSAELTTALGSPLLAPIPANIVEHPSATLSVPELPGTYVGADSPTLLPDISPALAHPPAAPLQDIGPSTQTALRNLSSDETPETPLPVTEAQASPACAGDRGQQLLQQPQQQTTATTSPFYASLQPVVVPDISFPFTISVPPAAAAAAAAAPTTPAALPLSYLRAVSGTDVTISADTTTPVEDDTTVHSMRDSQDLVANEATGLQATALAPAPGPSAFNLNALMPEFGSMPSQTPGLTGRRESAVAESLISASVPSQEAPLPAQPSPVTGNGALQQMQASSSTSPSTLSECLQSEHCLGPLLSASQALDSSTQSAGCFAPSGLHSQHSQAATEDQRVLEGKAVDPFASEGLRSSDSLNAGSVDPGSVDPGSVDPGSVDPGSVDPGALDVSAHLVKAQLLCPATASATTALSPTDSAEAVTVAAAAAVAALYVGPPMSRQEVQRLQRLQADFARKEQQRLKREAERVRREIAAAAAAKLAEERKRAKEEVVAANKLRQFERSEAARMKREEDARIKQERQQQRIQQANSSVPSGTPSQLSIASLAALAPTAGRGLWGRRILPPAPPNISAVIDTTHSAPAADAAVSSDGAAFAMSDAAVAAATTDTEAAAAVAEVAGAAGSREGVAVEGLVGLNMILARLGFEMLRSRGFEGWLRRTISRRLDEARRPAFLHPLSIVSLDLGAAAPQVKRVRAVAGMPGPEGAGSGSELWPQLAIDMTYVGEVCLVLQTKLELQNRFEWLRGGGSSVISSGSLSFSASEEKQAEKGADATGHNQDCDPSTAKVNAESNHSGSVSLSEVFSKAQAACPPTIPAPSATLPLAESASGPVNSAAANVTAPDSLQQPSRLSQLNISSSSDAAEVELRTGVSNRMEPGCSHPGRIRECEGSEVAGAPGGADAERAFAGDDDAMARAVMSAAAHRWDEKPCLRGKSDTGHRAASSSPPAFDVRPTDPEPARSAFELTQTAAGMSGIALRPLGSDPGSSSVSNEADAATIRAAGLNASSPEASLPNLAISANPQSGGALPTPTKEAALSDACQGLRDDSSPLQVHTAAKPAVAMKSVSSGGDAADGVEVEGRNSMDVGGGGRLVRQAFQALQGMIGATASKLAAGGQKIAAAAASSLARVPVQLSLSVTKFEGTLLVWIPPPPSNRLWLSFQSAPTIELKAQPINKVLQYTTMLTQLSGWVRSKVLDGLTRTLVFPAALDIKLPSLFAPWDYTDVRLFTVPNPPTEPDPISSPAASPLPNTASQPQSTVQSYPPPQQVANLPPNSCKQPPPLVSRPKSFSNGDLHTCQAQQQQQEERHQQQQHWQRQQQRWQEDMRHQQRQQHITRAASSSIPRSVSHSVLYQPPATSKTYAGIMAAAPAVLVSDTPIASMSSTPARQASIWDVHTPSPQQALSGEPQITDTLLRQDSGPARAFTSSGFMHTGMLQAGSILPQQQHSTSRRVISMPDISILHQNPHTQANNLLHLSSNTTGAMYVPPWTSQQEQQQRIHRRSSVDLSSAHVDTSRSTRERSSAGQGLGTVASLSPGTVPVSGCEIEGLHESGVGLPRSFRPVFPPSLIGHTQRQQQQHNQVHDSGHLSSTTHHHAAYPSASRADSTTSEPAQAGSHGRGVIVRARGPLSALRHPVASLQALRQRLGSAVTGSSTPTLERSSASQRPLAQQHSHHQHHQRNQPHQHALDQHHERQQQQQQLQTQQPATGAASVIRDASPYPQQLQRADTSSGRISGLGSSARVSGWNRMDLVDRPEGACDSDRSFLRKRRISSMYLNSAAGSAVTLDSGVGSTWGDGVGHDFEDVSSRRGSIERL